MFARPFMPGPCSLAAGVLVGFCAYNAELPASKAPAARAAINIVFVDFIFFVWLLLIYFHRAFRSGRIQRETQTLAQGYSPRKIFAAARTVLSMSAAVCAVEINP